MALVQGGRHDQENNRCLSDAEWLFMFGPPAELEPV